MLRDCDCGACCDQCGHLDDCIRWELTGDGPDMAAQVLAEDGYSRGIPALTEGVAA